MCGTAMSRRMSEKMIGVVIVTHCRLAEELIAAARLWSEKS